MFRQITIFIICIVFSLFVSSAAVHAQTNQEYSRGKIESIIEETEIRDTNGTTYIQKLEVKKQTGESVEITFGSEQQPIDEKQRFQPGDQVIVVQQPTPEGSQESLIADRWRVPIFWWLSALFFILVIAVARQQGLSSIFGMIASVGVLLNFIVPQILQGANPLFITLIGVLFIAGITMYLTHGWNIESHVALFSIVATLGVVAILSIISVQVAHLSGLGSEDAYYIQFSSEMKFNLQGLLLGGILLGALGVLDDICVAQVSVVRELLSVNKDLSFSELYTRAMAVGRDHVASLVNTLVLAYAGANLPLFLLFSLNKQIPLWVTINQEIIIEEVIRTLTGSIGLVFAVPMTTLIAVWMLHGKNTDPRPSYRAHRH